ncbi:MAG: 16S rRNA (cytosine(967)-C(5))-methyltransferase RsmB [Schwartzia sp.]|nr:16S rRNA (cytosine(967)-C(5))-methyltransferase RsmB [Schwartzia sp. (in: firmicutes)]
MDKARETAMKVLYAVHENGAYANVALVEAFREARLDDLERRFATELVYGAVKAGDTLDWIIRQYTKRPLRKMAPYVRAVLRLGVFQLFFLDKIPPSAVCNESTELMKKYGHIGTARFVNAILRTATREPEKARIVEGKDKAAYLSLAMQHPVWLIRRWLRAFGREETERLCAFDNAPAVLSLRTNLLRTTREALMERLREEGAEVRPSEWTPEGVLCTGHGALDASQALRDGLFQVQDESSMQVAHVVAPKPGEFVLDMCSAPGGKTTHLAEMMGNKGRIVALDIYDTKLARVEENAKRLGISIIETKCLDAREAGHIFAGKADRVLLDAPCSGLGVLRRRPDARWRKSEEEIAHLPELQRELLESAACAVRPGGVVVYSTCTIEPAENEEMVRVFLASHEEFVQETAGEYLPLRPSKDDMVQFYPQRHGIDGFFIARFRRKEA